MSATRLATSTTTPTCPPPTRFTQATGRAIVIAHRAIFFIGSCVVVVVLSVRSLGNTGSTYKFRNPTKPRIGPAARLGQVGLGKPPLRAFEIVLGVLRACRCGTVTARCSRGLEPGAGGQFSCLGHFCITPGQTTNYKDKDLSLVPHSN